jgi:glycosyltransferase involved in cell wall biosynthesis
MLAGLPILDSNNLIKDPVELSGCGIIVEPDSSEEIKKGIYKLYKLDEIELKKLGANGNTYVSKEHSIKNLSKRYTKLFQ